MLEHPSQLLFELCFVCGTAVGPVVVDDLRRPTRPGRDTSSLDSGSPLLRRHLVGAVWSVSMLFEPALVSHSVGERLAGAALKASSST
jgi:hypothetical protein